MVAGAYAGFMLDASVHPHGRGDVILILLPVPHSGHRCRIGRAPLIFWNLVLTAHPVHWPYGRAGDKTQTGPLVQAHMIRHMRQIFTNDKNRK